MVAAHVAIRVGLNTPARKGIVDEEDHKEQFLPSPLKRVVERVRRYATDHDSGAVLGPTATADIGELMDSLAGIDPTTVPARVVRSIADFHLARYQSLPEGEDQESLVDLLAWFGLLPRIDESQVPPSIAEVLETAEVHSEESGFNPELMSDEDLDSAVEDLARHVGEPSSGSADFAVLATLLATRHERTGGESDLRGALGWGRRAIDEASPVDARREAYAHNYGSFLMAAYQRYGDLAGLDECIEITRQVAEATSHSIPWTNLSVALQLRFERLGRRLDIVESVRAARRGVTIAEQEAPDTLCPALSMLSLALLNYSDASLEAEGLDEAVVVARRSVDLTPSGRGQQLAGRLTNLAMCLCVRFERKGDRTDIDEGVELARRSAEMTSASDPGAAGRHSNLALVLRTRGAWFGDARDLSEAVAAGERSVSLVPDDHPDRTGFMTNTADACMVWFDWSGDREALARSIELGRQAAARAPDDATAAITAQSNLSMYLLTAYEVFGDPAMLEDAISAVRYAHDHSADIADSQVLATISSNLSLLLRNRYELRHQDADVRDAIEAAVGALALTPEDSPDRASRLINLSLCHWARHNESDDEARRGDALAGAITTARQATMCPGSVSTRGAAWANLAVMLRERGGEGDVREADRAWREAHSNTAAPIRLRIDAALASAEVARLQGSTVSMVEAYGRAVDLLPIAAWRGFDVRTRTDALTRWPGLASQAGAAAIGGRDPNRALEMLEQGRAILWSSLLDLRTGSVEVRRADSELAGRLDVVARALAHESKADLQPTVEGVLHPHGPALRH